LFLEHDVDELYHGRVCSELTRLLCVNCWLQVRRLELVSQHREVQYRHESRKKEQELDKMKDRMHKLITDKTSRKAPGYRFTSRFSVHTKDLQCMGCLCYLLGFILITRCQQQ